ncbi:hypothetical protein [Cohnella panacarvi]|uniref:hypothetical protein n=1 Tax=Cohnella panacarvi TaxID=400776 RepID=UPI0012EB2DF4|nr:hypothetical protein [Cohnella panacarvi]
MDHEAYMRFLLQHHDDLNLPYSFAMKLSFLASPLFNGDAMLIFDEERNELAGAVGIVYGTGAGRYEDRHICQIEIAYLLPEYRRTTLFLSGLRALIGLIKFGEPTVEQLQFWVAADNDALRERLSRLPALPDSSMEIAEGMAHYKVSLQSLVALCRRFRKVTH